MKSEAEIPAGAVLIAAPTGRDAVLAAQTLAESGVPSAICAGIGELAARLCDETGAALIEEEALTPRYTPRLLERLRQQPAWSDLPLLILTSGPAAEAASSRILNLFGATANVTLLERPLGSLSLVSAAQTALRARRRQYQVRDLIDGREKLLASISDAFSALDHEWRYTYANQKVAELAGVPRERLIGRKIWEVFPDAVGTEFYVRCHRAMEARQPDKFEVYYEPWHRWLETRIYPTTEGIAVLRSDVTERRRTAEKLQESEDRLRLAIEAADIGTFDYYTMTGELRFSDRAKVIFGASPARDFDYATYIEALHPEYRGLPGQTVARLQSGETDRYEIEYRTIGIEDAQERWVAERGKAVRDASGTTIRYVGTVLDITERKTAEILLQRAKQDAEAANRAKDQFLAMLSHELRTPLTPVLMTIASLRRQPDLTDELHHDLEVLQRNVELEALLIDDLLDLTRIAHGKLELHNDAVDIHKSLDHALNISNSDLQAKQLTIIRHYNATEHHCWADAARLQQVFWNLVKNAVKFTPTAGRLEIRTHNDNAHNIIVDVTDTGIGIDAELLPRIFDAFEQGGRTTTSQYGGLGLGLAISKRVVDMHGGSLSAHSAGRGMGSTFTLRLAAMQTSMLDAPVTYLQDEPVALQPASILLVEDHADTARVLRRILEHAGFEVTHAGTVADARALASSTRFDLVISDVGLPDGTGVELMRFLHTHHRLRGIALSGFGTDDDVAASSAAGFAEHLTKPVDWPQLRGAINRVLASKTPKRTEAAVS